MTVTVSELNVYPIKSCKGNSAAVASVVARGFQFDREWMVVDDEGEFFTQRDVPKMALVSPTVNSDGLTLNAPGLPELLISHNGDLHAGGTVNKNASVGAQRTKRVIVWSDVCDAVDQGDAAAEWLSSFLGMRCRLVRMAARFVRQVDQDYALRVSDQVGFADGFPFLLISEESLGDLNSRLQNPIPMNRFRPNIVVKGCKPFEEDEWKTIRIGDIKFDVVKPCARCTITTINQDTIERGQEPLRTLASFRNVDNKVMFGQNIVHHSTGSIKISDPVEIIA